MNHVSYRMRSHRSSIGYYALIGAATLGATVLLIRAMPDLIRYMRVRQM